MPIELLREKKISSFAVTEWEGIAYSSKIKELAGTAYSVDTPYQSHRPTGMFWIKKTSSAKRRNNPYVKP